MQGVFLDIESIGPKDLDLSEMEGVVNWDFYKYTASEEEVIARIREAGVVIANKTVLSKKALFSARNLKLICVAATGVNNVDVEAAKTLGIVVTNVRGYATPSVVQHVFLLIFALLSHLKEYDTAVKAGRWQNSIHFSLLDYPITELAGKKVGIVGYGELGRAVARVATAFGAEVLIASRPGAVHSATPNRIPLEEMLSDVDVLTLHCPLTSETKGLIDALALAKMKPSAILINAARGGIVDELALADALKQQRLAGAGVDVLTAEPPHEGNPLLNRQIPNLIVTPHIAWASRESRQRLVKEISHNISAFISGQPRNVV